MSQGQRTSGRRGSYGAGRRMAGLCAVLMGVFALMTVLVLAGSGGKARLEGSLGYPDAGPASITIAPRPEAP